MVNRDLVLDEREISWFRASGFVVLRGAFDPEPLSTEVDAALTDAFRGTTDPGAVSSGIAGNEFRYVPMMCERTPVSLSLLDALGTDGRGSPRTTGAAHTGEGHQDPR